MSLWADLEDAVRALRQARGFFLTATTTMAFGMARCLVALAVSQAYLLRGLPYPASDRLYALSFVPSDQRFPRDLETLAWDMLDDIVEYPIAWEIDTFFLQGGAYPESLPGAWVTPGFVEGLGVSVGPRPWAGCWNASCSASPRPSRGSSDSPRRCSPPPP